MIKERIFIDGHWYVRENDMEIIPFNGYIWEDDDYTFRAVKKGDDDLYVEYKDKKNGDIEIVDVLPYLVRIAHEGVPSSDIPDVPRKLGQFAMELIKVGLLED